ncbi:MAG TPA: pyruvate kinase [Candidatus Avoscillospira stercorigallinarum]|uniref:Pyruvate kinase n=1 Tax=Candidatus Avoscillospira stercorigallinarum TaxID=2840708 RepID=A0A9D0Z543_9FIRM|nr:pyruvate kinase [Candidatus Avoscillospira stercorigallinarum]
MRKTKIICTIGPASQSEEVLTKMCLAGMNVARLNFSHGDHAEQLAKLNTIKKVREALNLPIAIMLDTKGPEFRIKTFEGGKITLADGDPFTFTARDVKGNQQEVSVSYPGLVRDLVPGDTILLNNGLLSFRVEEIQGKDIRCTTLIGGVLSDRKSMSFPGKMLSQPYLSEQDKKDILFGIANEVDYIACSFVSCAKDLEAVHEFLRANGGDDIALIAKIENQPGVDNIEEICSKCEGIMIGRGDMGVEIPFEELPAIQKQLITKCRMMGKRVITATEMLESMIYNPRPTRAEISDVANAVYDGTSAIMLSGESAMGKYPVEAVATMAKIAERTEQSIDFRSRFHSNQFEIHNIIDAISHATCGMAIDINAKAIVACSLSGGTVRLVSRFRPPMDILGITTNKKTWRKLALSWGVTPMMCEELPSTEVLFYTAKKLAQHAFELQPGDRIVITGGVTNGTSGNTNLIKVEQYT